MAWRGSVARINRRHQRQRMLNIDAHIKRKIGKKRSNALAASISTHARSHRHSAAPYQHRRCIMAAKALNKHRRGISACPGGIKQRNMAQHCRWCVWHQAWHLQRRRRHRHGNSAHINSRVKLSVTGDARSSWHQPQKRSSIKQHLGIASRMCSRGRQLKAASVYQQRGIARSSARNGETASKVSVCIMAAIS